jgi:vancomycin resistance protein YoaR
MKKLFFLGMPILLCVFVCGFFLFPFSFGWGQATSSLAGRTPQQLHNLKMAAARLNNTRVLPGATFSFNGVVGPYQIEAGYLPEKSFLGGKIVDSPGGGVCQLSSTLYYVLIRHGFACQRVAHAQPILSLPVGFDATVSNQFADLKFVNHLRSPMTIKAKMNGSRLYVGLWGGFPFPQKVHLQTEVQRIAADRLLVNVWSDGKLISQDRYITQGRMESW